MNYCPKCGTRVTYEMQFCPGCGSPLIHDDQRLSQNKDIVVENKYYPSSKQGKQENYIAHSSTVPNDYLWQNVDYMNGHTFELFCAEMLKNLGYFNVRVTPESGDNGVDILAYKNGITTAFQCKRYSGTVGNGAIQEVFAGGIAYGAVRHVVVTNSYFTKQARELAESLDVELWDRSVLFRYLSIAFPNSSYKKAYNQMEKNRRKLERQRAWNAFFDSDKKKSSGGGCLSTLIILAALLAFCGKKNTNEPNTPTDSVVIESQSEIGSQQITYHVQITSNVNLHKNVGMDTEVLIVIPKGTKLKYIEKQEMPNGYIWYKVTYDDKTGWLPGGNAREIP